MKTTTKPVTILFVHYGDNWIRGSEGCLLDLMSHLDTDRYRPLLWCNSQALVEAAQALHIEVVRDDFPLLLGWQAPRLNMRGWSSLVSKGKQLVEQHQVDLIHANSAAPMQWLNVVARLCQRPLLTHLHARYPARDRLTLGLHHSAMLVGVSQPVVDHVLQDGMPKERTRMIANGIDTQALLAQPVVDLRARLNLDTDDFLLATVGSLIHRKGIDIIIKALQQLTLQGLPAHLAIIGDGEERQSLQQLSHQLGLSQRVHFIGEQDRIASLLRGGVDVFVSGAREEVFGLVLAEAGLCQLPVVAPRVGGIPAVVDDGQTGLLVASEDPQAMANALALLQRHPQRRRQMGLAGKRRVMQRFTIERNVEQFDQLYQRLLSDDTQRMGWTRHWQLGTALKLALTSTCKALQQRFSNTKPRHILVLDPTAFPGGSKVATETALSLLDGQQQRVSVLTANSASWSNPQLNITGFYQFSWLAQQDQGMAFFLRHAYLAAVIIWARLRLGRIDLAVGASGPGVDLALYLLKPLLRFPILQLIHGPVAASRTLARCLLQADRVHYLNSSRRSLLEALQRLQPAEQPLPESLPAHFIELHNGLATDQWPSPCQHLTPQIFWAASLLKWKGLDTLLAALQHLPQRPETDICYIRPQQTALPITQAPVKLAKVRWHENPEDLDRIRSQCSIFISTSHQEPFGLSILEALAAGLCVVIPNDGAYWSQHLIDGQHCLMYQPGDEHDLAEKITALSADIERLRRLGMNGRALAEQYRAEQRLAPLLSDLNTIEATSDTAIGARSSL